MASLRNLLSISLLCVGSYAISFSSMGNVSTSLGGAGVALRNSAWGLYYNPALLSSDPRSKFSFSGGGYVARNNLNPLLEFDFSSTQEQINQVLNSLDKAQARLDSQFGVVAQIGGFYTKSVGAVQDEYGRLVSQVNEEQMSAFAIGAFASSRIVVSFQKASSTSYRMQNISLALMEIPIGYAYKLKTSYGDFNFGVALKYMGVAFDEASKKGSIYEGVNLEIPNWSRYTPSHNFGLDFGFLYSIADAHIGLSLKNITFPTFEFGNQKITLNPEMRLGISYEFLDHYTFVSDIDLIPVELGVLTQDKSLNIGFGLMGDYSFVDFRLGFQTDVFDFNHSRISAGINIYGILDIVGEMGFNFSHFSQGDLVLPTNFGVKIGSTFTF